MPWTILGLNSWKFREMAAILQRHRIFYDWESASLHAWFFFDGGSKYFCLPLNELPFSILTSSTIFNWLNLVSPFEGNGLCKKKKKVLELTNNSMWENRSYKGPLIQSVKQEAAQWAKISQQMSIRELVFEKNSNNHRGSE